MLLKSTIGNARVLAAGEIRGQRGSAKVRALGWTLVILAFIFISIKVIPPYFANYELEDWLNGNILAFMGKNIPNDDLTAAVVKEMANEGIEGTKENVKILQNNSRGLNVQVDYNVKVDLMVYQLDLHFTPHTNSQQLVQ
jgi:hypothetical protein